MLCDDRALARMLPAWITRGTPGVPARPYAGIARAVLAVPLAVVLFTASTLAFAQQMLGRGVIPAAGRHLLEWIAPLRSVNAYGLFARMMTLRNEIVIEGSDDGRTWTPYEFRWKPGDVMRRPTFVAPHQPRLGWQMWFAALTPYRANPEQWVARFLGRLLEGAPEVLALLASNPFPNAPPHQVRAVVFEYHFSEPGTSDGAWRRRESRGLYAPPLSRDY